MNSKKKVITIVLIVVIAALVLGSAYMLERMPKFRVATQEEIEKYAVYKVDWKKLEGSEGKSEMDIILSMCTEVDPSTVAPAAADATTATEETTVKYYTSETLSQYLHLYKGDLAVTLSDGVLSVGYTEQSGLVIVLGYNEKGFYALGVHDGANDFAYFEQDGSASVATNIGDAFGG